MIHHVARQISSRFGGNTPGLLRAVGTGVGIVAIKTGGIAALTSLAVAAAPAVAVAGGIAGTVAIANWALKRHSSRD